MAELERDPQHSTAKRQQRSQAFNSHMSHSSLERQLLSVQAAKTELENKLRQKEVYIEQLEGDRRFLAEREQAEHEEKEKERKANVEDKKIAEADLRSLRDAIATLRNENIDLEESYSTLQRSHTQLVAAHKAGTSTLTQRSAELEQELVEYRAVAEERDATIRALQQKLDEAEAASDPMLRRRNEDESWSIIRDELHRQASYLRSLETMNAKLNAELGRYKDRHANLEVLREEKRALERKVLVVDELREKVVSLEAQVDAARRERQEWANKSHEAGTPSEPSLSVVQSLSELRLTHARLLEEHGANIAVLRSREAELARVNESFLEAQRTMETSQGEVQLLNDKVVRREQRAQLAEREVGFLQALVASFTAEDQASREVPTLDSGLSKHVHHLEQSLSEYKAANTQLQNALDAFDGEDGAGGARLSRRELRQQMEYHKGAAKEATEEFMLTACHVALEEARSTVKVQEDRAEELAQTLFELRGKIGAGNHVPPGMRVLCLRDNPAQQWRDLRQSIMDRLKNENEALIRRLKEVESSGAVEAQAGTSRGEELVPRESWEVLQKEKEELEEVVKQKEKRLLRLQQVFTAKSAEFREAIASILGLKLAFYPNGQVRVTSIYDLSASFVFQPLSKTSADGDGARMQLVAQGEGGPQDLPQLVHYWVEEEQCIPGFLASVTLECYDKSKREGAG
ncbi:spindle assembly checkpoint component Mad1 [Boletus edulis BED1]|uniref:Spindle assembly checkpoint component MAD1 n=1 Tax=Boletus edulis BED1 TaxID=1328754 RepID=A0AAD4GLB9_BOLED|nr:spindle assembly checkpoint component Mad1 [Boletus edulis BED1]